MTFGILFGFISMIAFGISAVLFKIILNEIDYFNTALKRNFFMSISLMIFVYFLVDSLIISFSNVLLMLLMGIIGVVPLLFVYKAMEHEKVSLVYPISYLWLPISVILAVIFYDEKINILQIFAIILVFIGVFLSSIDMDEIKKRKFRLASKGVFYALLTAVGWGIFNFILKIPVKIIGPLLTSAYLETFVFMYLILMLPIKKYKRSTKNNLTFIILAAFFGAVGSLTYSLGINYEMVSIIMAISAGVPLITVLAGRFFLKEKIAFYQKIGIAGIILGLVLISI